MRRGCARVMGSVLAAQQQAAIGADAAALAIAASTSAASAPSARYIAGAAPASAEPNSSLLGPSSGAGWSWQRQQREGLHSSARAAAAQPAEADDPMQEMLTQQLEGFREAGTFKVERVITSAQGPEVAVAGAPAGGEVLNFW